MALSLPVLWGGRCQSLPPILSVRIAKPVSVAHESRVIEPHRLTTDETGTERPSEWVSDDSQKSHHISEVTGPRVGCFAFLDLNHLRLLRRREHGISVLVRRVF